MDMIAFFIVFFFCSAISFFETLEGNQKELDQFYFDILIPATKKQYPTILSRKRPRPPIAQSHISSIFTNCSQFFGHELQQTFSE